MKPRLFFGFSAFLIALTIFSTLKLVSDSKPVINAEILQLALKSEPPQKLLMSDAIEFFEQRLDRRNGDDLVAQNKLVPSYLLRFKAYGRPEDLAKAQRHLHDLLKRTPSKAFYHANQSAIYMAEHQFDQALKSARRAIELSKNGEGNKLYLRLFDALFVYGKYEEAREILRTKSFNRKSFDFLVRSARLEDKLGNLESAKSIMQRALRTAKAYAQSPVVIAWCHVTLGHFEHHSGNPEKAAQNYLRALELLPGYSGALEGLAALSHTIDHNLPTARRLYQHALRNGGELDIYTKLIEIEQELGNDKAAEETMHNFIDLASENPDTERLFYRPLALLLAEEGEVPEQALKYAKWDLRNRPNSESYDVLSWVLYKMGDLKSAFEAAKIAVDWGSPEPHVLYHAGIIFSEYGKLAESRVLLEKALDSSAELNAEVIQEIQTKMKSI